MKHTAEDHKKLLVLFEALNQKYFEGILPPIELKFSGKLKTTGGQYFKKPKRKIQISSRYLAMENTWQEIQDTLGHEMIHYWLDHQEKPCGHTKEFKQKLKDCGFNRYSRLTPVHSKYLYQCPKCLLQYPRKKKGTWSCGPCSGKKFNSQYKLVLQSELKRPVTEKKNLIHAMSEM